MIPKGVHVYEAVAIGQEFCDSRIFPVRILVLYRYYLDVGILGERFAVSHVIHGQNQGQLLFIHGLGDITEALGNHSEDVLEVVGYLMARFIACTIALALAFLGVAPERLADTFLHNPANLAAGGVVFYADGDIPEEFAIHEFEAFAGEIGALLLDEFGFRVAFVFHVG